MEGESSDDILTYGESDDDILVEETVDVVVRRRNAATSRNAGGLHRRSLECRRD
jgi:hypothetical protein